jgi:hypothetical protein
LVKVSNTKVVPNILICLCKISNFFRSINIFSILFSHLLKNSNEKGILKREGLRGPFFSVPACFYSASFLHACLLLQCLSPSLCVRQPSSCYHVVATVSRAPPFGAFSLKSSLPPVPVCRRQSNSRRRAGHTSSARVGPCPVGRPRWSWAAPD